MFKIEIDGVEMDAFVDSDGYLTELYAGSINIAPMLDTLFNGSRDLHERLQALVDKAAMAHYADMADEAMLDRLIG